MSLIQYVETFFTESDLNSFVGKFSFTKPSK